MPPVAADAIRTQLTDRRQRLSQVIAEVGSATDLLELLRAVDGALERLNADRFGLCEVCGEEVSAPDLHAHPLLQYCLCDLSAAQQAALERDLGLARRVQLALLPAPDLTTDGWDVHYRYLPAGAVSGDYLDVVPDDASQGLYLVLGDVSGKKEAQLDIPPGEYQVAISGHDVAGKAYATQAVIEFREKNVLEKLLEMINGFVASVISAFGGSGGAAKITAASVSEPRLI